MKILLEAPILTQSGYGEHSRLIFESLKGTNHEIYTNPLNWGNTPWIQITEHEIYKNSIIEFYKYVNDCKQSNQEVSFDMQIHVGIPNEFEKKAPYSVCVTAGIETDRVSPNWLMKTHQGIDKIIVPSEHSKSGFTSVNYEVVNNSNNTKTLLKCNCPIEVVPYPVKQFDDVELQLDLKTEFNFLSVALLGPRKNIENSIIWFLQEFKDNPEVGLILKTARSKSSLMDKRYTKDYINSILDKYKDSKCKVYLLHGSLTPAEMNCLYNNPKIKVLMSATHGEGYGLPLFEAAYNAMPVVVTDWSSHLDFLTTEVKQKSGKTKERKLFARVDYNLGEVPKEVLWKDIIVEGSRWAYPKERSFKEQIRKVYKDYGMYKKWAKVLQSKIVKEYSKDIVLEKMKNALIPENMRITEEEISEEIDEMFASLSRE